MAVANTVLIQDYTCTLDGEAKVHLFGTGACEVPHQQDERSAYLNLCHSHLLVPKCNERPLHYCFRPPYIQIIHRLAYHQIFEIKTYTPCCKSRYDHKNSTTIPADRRAREEMQKYDRQFKNWTDSLWWLTWSSTMVTLASSGYLIQYSRLTSSKIK